MRFRALSLCFAWFRWFGVWVVIFVFYGGWRCGGFGGMIPLLACLFLGFGLVLFAVLCSLVCWVFGLGLLSGIGGGLACGFLGLVRLWFLGLGGGFWMI